MSPELVHFVGVLPEPSLLLTASGEVVFANRGAGDLIGRDVQSLVGVPLEALVNDPPEKVQSYLRLCARNRQLVPGALAWITKGGRSLEIRCDGTVVRPKSESEPAVLFLRCRPKTEATDRFALLNQKIAELSAEVLERKKTEQQRDELLQSERAARIEAERNSRVKDEFLATVSHELRTPLNAILGWAQLLRRKKMDPQESAAGLETIERNARAQAHIIEDLLDISRIISGKVRLDVQRVELQSVIEAAVASIRPAAEAKRIRLQVAIDPIAGPVKGDPSRLQQVVWNLLSNAVKFTPKGGRVQVFLERVNSHVEIVVSDTGEGIKPEFLPHVFDRFRQADASITRRHGGLGLGLSLVKQIVDLHGGSVRAKSPGEGQGSTFMITLPLLVLHDDEPEGIARVHPATHPAGEARGAAPLLSGVNVLVVDDEPDARELMRRLLEDRDAAVVTAASAEEALGAMQDQRPDVLLCDIGMPLVDGYELIRRLRSLPEERGGRTPAVAVTAFARSEDRTRSMLAGFNVHLAKPIESDELVATVASLAGRTGMGGDGHRGGTGTG